MSKTPSAETPSAPKTADEFRALRRRVLQVGDAAGDFIKYWGFKKIHGRVWTLLGLSNAPLAQSEIVSTLNVSRSQVSSAIAELVELGLVRPVDDHRNAPYEAVLDVWPTIADILRKREWMLLESAKMALDGAIEEASLSGPRELPFSAERMKMLLTMTELAQSLLRIVIAARVQSGFDLTQWAEGTKSFLGALSKMYPEVGD